MNGSVARARPWARPVLPVRPGATTEPEHLPGAAVDGDRQWFRVQASGGSTAVIDIYDEIGWFGVSADRLVAEVKQLDVDTIRVNINSPGGDMWDGIAIYNALVEHPARIEVKVDALAASAASVIAQAGDHVAMNAASQMMIHDAWGLCAGNADDMTAMAVLLNQASDNLAQLYAGTTGEGTAADWRDRMRAESWYNATEAVDAGLADEVLPVAKRGDRAPAAEAKFDLTRYLHAGRAEAPAPKIAKVAARAGQSATIPSGSPRLGVEGELDTTGTGPANGDAGGATPGPVDNPVGAVDTPAHDGALILAALGDADPTMAEGFLLEAADAVGLDAEAAAVRDQVDPFHFDPDVFVAVMQAAVENAPAPSSRPAPPPRQLPHTIDIDELVDAIKEGALS